MVLMRAVLFVVGVATGDSDGSGAVQWIDPAPPAPGAFYRAATP